MDAGQIARRRMRAQRVWGGSFDEPAEAVSWLTAVQAQEHWYARWSIGQRTRGCTAEDFDRAFDAGRILRTHILRPTWHYVTPADLAWLVQLSGPRVIAANATRYRQLGLEPAVLARSNSVIARTVADGHRVRREIAGALEEHGLSTEEQRLAYMLLHAELEGVICSGAMRGKQHTYAAFEQRVSSAPSMRGEAALVELARRYFTARGPATVADFAWWSGFTMADARAAIDVVEPDLSRRDLDGRTYWFVEPYARSGGNPRVDLVQCYDETIISYRESRDVLHSARDSFGMPGGIDGFRHVLLVDGRLLGHWRVTRARRGTLVESRITRRVAADERIALARGVERLARFLGEPLV